MHVNKDFAKLSKAFGITFEGAMDYLPDDFKSDHDIAMDALPNLVTTSNAGIPFFLTTLIDPDIIKILLAPNKGAEILGEVKKGSWLDETAMFPIVERTGEVSSYGDRNNNGRAGINTDFPQRQAYLYQTILDWGQRELERAGLARIGYAAEVREAGTIMLNKFQNLSYFFGVSGLQNYGILTDPNLTAYLAPAPKAYGGTAWISSGVVKAQANEVYADIQSLFLQLVAQSDGLISQDDAMKLCMSPSSAVALTATNSFNVNVNDLLKKNFPKIEIVTAVQYGSVSSSNTQGITGGNVIQLICEKVETQKTGFCAFNEKLRTFPVKVELSSFRQKMVQGTWGAVIRQPFAIAQMQGI
jgi:hypothetical protein